jgi:hypothetical protein
LSVAAVELLDVDAFDAVVDVWSLVAVDPAGRDPFREPVVVDLADPTFL